MKVAYLVNQYPRVTHSFIRREILSLERQGLTVQRIALRGWSEPTPDPQDLKEQANTRYVLRRGIWGMIGPTLRAMVFSPVSLFRALRIALHLSRHSDHRHALHLVRVAEACVIVPWLRASGATHLHAHFGTNSAEVAMYARCLGGPVYSFTVHGPEEFESPMGLAEKVRHAAFVAAISSYCRSQLFLRCEAALWPRVQVVRCGVEPAFFREIGAQKEAASGRLVCVGRLCEAKGQLLLIEAAAQLRERGTRLDLVLAGDGPLRAEIEAGIKRHGLGGSVRITGWISSDEVRKEILAARALVLPSFAEGLPVVIMEAMTLRRPVLSTYIAGIPELVLSGATGWLFPAGSLEALTDAIADCLSRPDTDIKRMGDAAYARVMEFHSIDTEAGKLARLFGGGSAAAAG